MSKLQRVMVSLGLPKGDGGPMPATIWRRRDSANCKFQYLSADQLAEMSGETSAMWMAEFADEIWWLKQKLSDEQDVVVQKLEAAE